jgi:hypothetical protein
VKRVKGIVKRNLCPELLSSGSLCSSQLLGGGSGKSRFEFMSFRTSKGRSIYVKVHVKDLVLIMLGSCFLELVFFVG